MAQSTHYTEELADQICDEIASGKSLRQISQIINIAPSTICKWILQNDEFREHYTRAKEMQAELLADEIVSIADSATNESYNAARLQVDSRKWVASKLLAKKYGEKLEHTGPEGGPIQIVSTIPRPPKE